MNVGIMDFLFLIGLTGSAYAACNSRRVMGVALALMIAFIMMTDSINSQLVWVPLVGTPSGAAILIAYVFSGMKFLTSSSFRRHCLASWHVMAFLGLLSLAWGLGPDREMTFSFLLRFYGSVFGLFLLASHEFKEAMARRAFISVLMVLVAIAVTFSFWQALTDGLGFGADLRDPGMVSEALTGEVLRVPSFWGSAYSMAEFCLLFIPLLFPLLGKRQETHLAWLAFGSVAYALLLTQVRSGILILVVQGLMYMALSSDAQSFKILLRRLAIATGVLAAIVLLIYIYADKDGIFGRLISTLQANSVTEVDDSSSAVSRLVRISIAWDIFSASPIFGMGIGKMPYIYPDYGWFFENFLGGAHNVFLQVMAESGLIGLAGLFIWLGRTGKQAISKWKRLRAASPRIAPLAILGLATLVMDGLFSEIFCYPSRFSAILILAFIIADGSLMDAFPNTEAEIIPGEGAE